MLYYNLIKNYKYHIKIFITYYDAFVKSFYALFLFFVAILSFLVIRFVHLRISEGS